MLRISLSCFWGKMNRGTYHVIAIFPLHLRETVQKLVKTTADTLELDGWSFGAGLAVDVYGSRGVVRLPLIPFVRFDMIRQLLKLLGAIEPCRLHLRATLTFDAVACQYHLSIRRSAYVQTSLASLVSYQSVSKLCDLRRSGSWRERTSERPAPRRDRSAFTSRFRRTLDEATVNPVAGRAEEEDEQAKKLPTDRIRVQSVSECELVCRERIHLRLKPKLSELPRQMTKKEPST
nr:hypothetical protein CFP56_60198 [Quercus suber]